MARKEYTKGQLTVVWQPGLCIHSEICMHGLPKVFDPGRKPWIDMDQAEADAIEVQVKNCPSGALSIKKQQPEHGSSPQVKVQLVPGGPVLLRGACQITDENGQVATRDNLAFCRCGRSQKFPYCDGSHKN